MATRFLVNVPTLLSSCILWQLRNPHSGTRTPVVHHIRFRRRASGRPPSRAITQFPNRRGSGGRHRSAVTKIGGGARACYNACRIITAFCQLHRMWIVYQRLSNRCNRCGLSWSCSACRSTSKHESHGCAITSRRRKRSLALSQRVRMHRSMSCRSRTGSRNYELAKRIIDFCDQEKGKVDENITVRSG